ncbi:arginine and glutamate-rich protein 1-B-like [Macrobrachium rosenbergii]|uniref:arginine and glutamate-rich protein 1-B-like n=1 Tax=Macrobrachium rosenbergii TaxID=79674 RepID=UPI0034D7AE16
MDLGKEAGLTGPALTKWIKEQLAERRQHEEEQRQQDEDRAERRRQHKLALKESEQALKASELVLKDKEIELERARKESTKAIASQQASNPIPAAPNAPLSSLNSLVPKWTEEEPEERLEEVEALFDNFNTTEAERDLSADQTPGRKSEGSPPLAGAESTRRHGRSP